MAIDLKYWTKKLMQAEEQVQENKEVLKKSVNHLNAMKAIFDQKFLQSYDIE